MDLGVKILSIEDGFETGEQSGFLIPRKLKPTERLVIIDTAAVLHPGMPCPLREGKSSLNIIL